MKRSICLKNATVGNVCEIADILLSTKQKKRLEVLGMNPGVKLQILNKKHSKAMIVYVRDTRFALGAGITANILVYKISESKG